jgi:MoxR-like ATPase
VKAVKKLNAESARKLAHDAASAIGRVIRGQDAAGRLVLATVFARGHLLIEDVPGVGKTTLARTVAKVLGCTFSRIQFTADLLPSDVLGVSMLSPQDHTFEFKPGPIFANVVLADEINRASPKTQSAMLEAMSDGQVSIDDATRPLESPFTVLATQNPVEHHGAYPLPESQLDRFMARIRLGYPPREEERALLLAPGKPQAELEDMQGILGPQQVRQIQNLVAEVRMENAVADYLLEVVEATRNHPDVILGCSPRGSVAFASLVRAAAFIDGRDYVIPDDVQRLAKNALAHRLVVADGGGGGGRQRVEVLVDEIISQVAVPR